MKKKPDQAPHPADPANSASGGKGFAMEINYTQHGFEFEPLPGKPFTGRLRLNESELQLLEEDDCWYLDDDGQRLPEDQLFAASPWSCSGPAGPIKLLCRFFDHRDGTIVFDTPESYAGDVSRWVHRGG